MRRFLHFVVCMVFREYVIHFVLYYFEFADGKYLLAMALFRLWKPIRCLEYKMFYNIIRYALKANRLIKFLLLILFMFLIARESDRFFFETKHFLYICLIFYLGICRKNEGYIHTHTPIVFIHSIWFLFVLNTWLLVIIRFRFY